MIRRSAEKTVVVKKMFDGQGQGILNNILNTPEEMYNKGRVFAHVVLEKDCEVAWHIHNGDGETYYILKGEGEYSDNGVKTTLYPGDVAFVDAGEGHSIINLKDEPLEMMALILFEKQKEE